MRKKTTLITIAILALSAGTAWALSTDVFDKSQTSFKYCLAKYVAPYPDMPEHRIYKCEGGIQDVTDGHSIDIALGTHTYNRDSRSGDLETDCQACGKFGGWDADGTRHVYWIEAPRDYNDRESFSNYYRFSDLTHGPMASEADLDKAGVRCGGQTGSGTHWAYSFYAGDDVALAGDKRAGKGREVLEAEGRTILAAWDIRPPDGAAGKLGDYWGNDGQGVMRCRVVIEDGARADSVLEQRDQIEVWNNSEVQILPGASHRSGNRPGKAGKAGGGAPVIKLPWQR